MDFTYPSVSEFEELVAEAISEIPQEFQEKLDNVNTFVEDWPTREQLIRTKSRMLFGLYEGIPQTKRGHYGIGGALPDKITLFRMPILRVSQDIKIAKELVRDIVLHEIAHHFGMNESEIRNAEKRRRTNI